MLDENNMDVFLPTTEKILSLIFSKYLKLFQVKLIKM